MSATAYRASLVRHINQKIDTADRTIANIRGEDKGNSQAVDYYRGFREAYIELLTMVDDMEAQG